MLAYKFLSFREKDPIQKTTLAQIKAHMSRWDPNGTVSIEDHISLAPTIN